MWLIGKHGRTTSQSGEQQRGETAGEQRTTGVAQAGDENDDDSSEMPLPPPLIQRSLVDDGGDTSTIATPLPPSGMERQPNLSMPGAWRIPGRPVRTDLPSWRRRLARRNNSDRSRGSRSTRSGWTRSMRTRRSRSRHSHIPPELRPVHTDSMQSSVRDSQSHLQEQASAIRAEVTAVNPSDCDSSCEEDNNRFTREVWAVLCFVIVGAIVAVVILVVLTATRNRDELSSTTPSPTESPSVPTILLDETPRVISLREALYHFSTDPSVLEDQSSPQYDALLWLADIDEVPIEPEDSLDRLSARYALATIFYATNGERWSNDLGFLASTHECTWSSLVLNEAGTDSVKVGVSCNDDMEVTALDLDNNNLQGYIPEEIKALSSLRHLSVASNLLPGGRPGLDAIESLRNIAELGGGLRSLDVSDNAWDTVIPSTVALLSNVEILHLEWNEFKFTIPSEFANLSSLKELYLHNNRRLIGAIEDIVENLPKLEVLNAESCGFSISSELRFPTSLTTLSLKGDVSTLSNSFDRSPLSSNIGRLSNLKTLNLEATQIEGQLPTEVGLLTNLHVLALANNNLRGQFPWALIHAPTLRQLGVGFSKLTGRIPEDINRFSNLNVLGLEGNDLVGTIPPSIGDLVNLKIFDARQNYLRLTIPSEVGRLTDLEIFRVPNNLLTGTLPTEMANMNSLALVRVHGNDLVGGDVEFVCSRSSAEGSSSVGCLQNITCSCCVCV